jgi:hypothetical protein
VCTDYALEHVVASPLPPAGGSQGTGQGLEWPVGTLPTRNGEPPPWPNGEPPPWPNGEAVPVTIGVKP